MKKINLNEEYAIVLQQIDENGEEDFNNLAETLRFDRDRLNHMLQNLKHRGLILTRYTPYDQWIHLSTKGKKVMQATWPERNSLSYS